MILGFSGNLDYNRTVFESFLPLSFFCCWRWLGLVSASSSVVLENAFLLKKEQLRRERQERGISVCGGW